MEQYLLAIDTSSKALSVALLKGTERLAEDGITAERNHSIYLVPVVQRLLAACDVKVEQLQAIAVGQGPGSYTGVRIGVTVAKTMAWSLKIPLLGVSSLAALAHRARAEAENVVVHVPLIDARRGQAYSALYADEHGWWQTRIEDRIVVVDQWLADVAEEALRCQACKVVLSGDTAVFAQAITLLQERLQSHGVQVECTEQALSAYHVGLLARKRLLNGEQDDVHTFVPNYTQLAEAEAKFLAARSLAGKATEA